jgi:AraC-like DNA-binding protein
VNVVHAIGRTPTIALERFGHDPTTPHRDPEREQAAGHAINFVCSGSFRVRTGEIWRAVTPDCLFVTSPGLEFSCAHDAEYPEDDCLSVLYSDSAIESLRSAGAGAVLSPPPGIAPVLEMTNRRAYLRHSLAASPRGEAARLEALAGALYWTLGVEPGRRPLFRAQQLSWYAARIDRAKELMRSEFAEPLSLSRLAREVGMSLYPFARIFSELEGETPHRFLVGVRLREAARLLREGGQVTEVCFAVGFGSLSHFSTTFRSEFGQSPSAFRQEPARPPSFAMAKPAMRSPASGKQGG